MSKEQDMGQSSTRRSLASWLPEVGQLAILILVAFILFLPEAITPNQLPAGWAKSDLMISHWPSAIMIQRTFVQEHRLALWDPYYAGGQPLIADPLAALFYPPTHLVHFLSLRHYYLVLIIGHFIFAGLGMLLLARLAAGLPRFPALIAAISFMATPRLISHLGAGHVTILQTVSWFPWLALACWATVRNPRWGALLGICIGMLLLAGHPQIAYYGLLMVVGMAVWLLVKRWRQDGQKALIRSIAGLAAGGIIGVLLAAIQLLPIMEFTAVSTRQFSVKSVEPYPLPYFFLALFGHLQSPIGPWEKMISPGGIVLALAIIALVICWRKIWPLLLGIVLVAGLAMGNSSPLYLLAAKILPGFDLFRGLARIWFISLMIIALIAGFGADALLARVRRYVPAFATALISILLVLAVTITLVVTDFGSARALNVNVATTPTALEKRASQLAGSGRIYDVQSKFQQLSAVELQQPLANGQNPLLIGSYVTYMDHAAKRISSDYQLQIPSNIQNARLLGFMHVSIVVSQRVLTDRRLVRIDKVGNTLIYKNTLDAGAGYLVSPSSDGNMPTLDQMQRLNNNVRTVTMAPEQETFSFSTNTEAYFVVATPTFPGWVANLDGHTATIQTMAGVFPAIKVGPGTHTLSYTYAPTSLLKGAILSSLGLLAALVWLIMGLWRRPMKKKVGSDGGSEQEEIGSETEVAEEVPARSRQE